MIASDEIKKLVLLRLETMPETIRVSVGSEGKELGREDLIDHVRREDYLGKMIIEMQVRYLKSMKTGF